MTGPTVEHDRTPNGHPRRGHHHPATTAGRASTTRPGEDRGPRRPAPVAESDITPQQLPELQRTAGNRAIADRMQRPARTAKTLAVQRFPATALSAAVDWKSSTASVFRPGEGMSGGVYILTSKDPQQGVAKVVVKPIFGANALGTETGEQLQFGDRALRLLGVSTPQSRVVPVGTPEYSNLLSVLRPHQPPRPAPGPVQDDDNPTMDEPAKWVDLSASHSFIVMGEVSNAKSLASMATAAANSPAAAKDLIHVVFFTPDLIQQLARMAVGDLLLGNRDRMVLGAMNLGNIMVSSDGTAHAIDTTAVLPKAVDPKDIASSGTSSGGGFTTAKGDIDDPIDRLRGFFQIMIARMKESAKPLPDGVKRRQIWEIFQDVYGKRQQWTELVFRSAFADSLKQVADLVKKKSGRAKLKSLTEDYDGKKGSGDLSHATLKANAMYLAGRAGGKEHDDAAAEAAAYAAYRQLMALDMSQLTIPSGDRFAADGMATHASSSVRGAEVPSIAPLNPRRINLLRSTAPRAAQAANDFDSGAMAKMGQDVALVTTVVQSDLGTKRRGGRDKTRNRVQAAEYLAGSYLVAGGAVRAMATIFRFSRVSSIASYLAGGGLRPQQAVNVLGAIRAAEAKAPAMRQSAGAYMTNLRAIATDVAKFKRFAGATELAQSLTAAADGLVDTLDGTKPTSLANSTGELARTVPVFLTSVGAKKTKKA